MVGLESALIAQLLLDYAQRQYLEEVGLNRDNKQDWIAMLEGERKTKRGSFYAVEISVLALYCATRPAKQKRTGHSRIEVDLLTLSRFAEAIKMDEFEATSSILESIKKDAGRKRIKKAQASPKPQIHEWSAIEAQRQKWLAEGVPEREISDKVCERFEVPKSTYRSWRSRNAKKNDDTVMRPSFR